MAIRIYTACPPHVPACGTAGRLVLIERSRREGLLSSLSKVVQERGSKMTNFSSKGPSGKNGILSRVAKALFLCRAQQH